MNPELPIKVAKGVLSNSDATTRSKLLDKISSAISILYEPIRIRRLANAEVDAELIHTGGPLGLSLQETQYLKQLIYREEMRSKNFSNIIEKALPLISDNADPSNIDDDWLNSFFDKASRVSSDEMQTIWANILAGETNRNNSFSRQTLIIVDQLSKDNASAFTALGSYTFMYDGSEILFLYNIPDDNEILNYESLIQLESLGLIRYSNLGDAAVDTTNPHVKAKYFNKNFSFDLTNKKKKDGQYQINCGYIHFTKPGTELISICGAELKESVFKDNIAKWENMGIAISVE